MIYKRLNAGHGEVEVAAKSIDWLDTPSPPCFLKLMILLGMKWFVLYQFISGDLEGVAAGCVRDTEGFRQGLKPIGCERFTPGLKPRPPKKGR
jgi:hypothetical protein